MVKNSTVSLAILSILLSPFCLACRYQSQVNGRNPTDKNQALMGRMVEVKSKLKEDRATSGNWRVKVLTGQEDLRSLQFVDESEGWAVGIGNGLYKTSDGGETWERVMIADSIGMSVSKLYFVNQSVGWVVLAGEDKNASDHRVSTIKITKTSDGGKTWNVQFTDEGVRISRMKFVDEQNGWAVGMRPYGNNPRQDAHFVVYTKDSGKTWTDTSQQVNQLVADDRGFVMDDITDIHSTSSSNVTLLSLRGKIFGTTNGGAAWSQVDAIESEPNQTCICRIGTTVSGRRWVAGGTYAVEGIWGVLLVRRDDTSWVRSRLQSVYFADVLNLSEHEYLASGSVPIDNGRSQIGNMSEGVILYSSDDGQNWAIIYRNEKVETIRELAAFDSNHIWATSGDGLVLRLDAARENMSQVNTR